MVGRAGHVVRVPVAVFNLVLGSYKPGVLCGAAAARHIDLNIMRQHLDAGLDEPLGPARLLGFEGGHLDGQLRRALDLGQVFELPAGQLRAVAQVGVFGERVVLPAAAVAMALMRHMPAVPLKLK